MLDTAEHYSWFEGLPHLQNIPDDCAKHGVQIPNLTTKEPVTTSILTPQ